MTFIYLSTWIEVYKPCKETCQKGRILCSGSNIPAKKKMLFIRWVCMGGGQDASTREKTKTLQCELDL